MRLLQRLFHHRVDGADMLARSHLGEYPAVWRMQVDLRCDHTREQRAPILNDRRGCLVARTFNAQNAGRRKG